MSTWLEERLSGLVFLWNNPAILAVVLIILLPIYWIQGRLFRRTTRKATLAQYGGLNRDAKRTTRAHETGIGMQSALVLRPVASGVGGLILALVFFGGGAAFMGLVVLPEPENQTVKNYTGFVISLGFVVLGLWALLGLLARIEMIADRIEHRRFLRPRRVFQIRDIVEVRRLGKAPGAGVILMFRDGRRLRLPASYAGYIEALTMLWPAHPQIAGYLLLAQATKRAVAQAK